MHVAEQPRIITLFVLILCTVCVIGGTLEDVENLHTVLLQNYIKSVRPLKDTFTPVTVNVSFNMIGIKDFDEVKGKFEINGFFVLTWIEPRLTWNPLEYNSTYWTLLPLTDVWTPLLTLMNPYKEFERFGKDFLPVQYHYSGYATFITGDVISSICNADVTNFPFDTQTCALYFMSWGYSEIDIYLHPMSTDAGLRSYNEHGTWKLKQSKLYTETANGGVMLSVKIKIKRKSTYFLVNIILPVIFLATLNCLVFTVPVDCGERVSYAITVVLALAVFLTIVGDNLPKTSEPMSRLSFFLLAVTTVSSLNCFMAILTVNIYYKPKDVPVPMGIKRLMEKFKWRLNRKIKENTVDPVLSSIVLESSGEKSTKETTYPTACVDDEITWKKVTNFLDNVFILINIVGLIVFVIGSIASTNN